MNAEPTAWIELENVSKRYGRQAVLAGASVTVERGQFVTVMGRSGSGKSTLLRLIGGLEAADSGLVRVDDIDLTALTETERARRRRHGLGFVFQSFNLIPTLTVAENVELPLALNDVAPEKARRLRRELLKDLGLADCADRFPEDISGGEQQRVAIARAVIHEPKLVLADEPTGNLDAETAQHVLELLRRTCGERNATLIVASHSAELAARADRVVTIRAGRIEEFRP
ncbi:MAG TPA: ABC transporter ATP-binding protein [Gammaproteobacteria bacterium]|nr:ABC transporter ATP-binding protein [Gammaproteobacteria bacterium]